MMGIPFSRKEPSQVQIYKKKHHDFSKPPALRCSFCGQQQGAVKKLIAGPTVYICDACVAICNEIIADDAAYDQLCRGHHELDSDAGVCSFCHTALPASQILMIAERGQLCSDCLAATRLAISGLGDE